MNSATGESSGARFGRLPLAQPAVSANENRWVKPEWYNLPIDNDLMSQFVMDPTASVTGRLGKPTGYMRIFTVPNDSVTELEYPQTMADIFLLHQETMRVVEGLQSQIDGLTKFVATLADRSAEQGDVGSKGDDYAVMSAVDRLNQASDAGEVDEQVLELANELLPSDDGLAHIAAIRAIAVADPQRGLELATAALETEENSIFRSVLRSVQRSVG